jgi:hypothetical protein
MKILSSKEVKLEIAKIECQDWIEKLLRVLSQATEKIELIQVTTYDEYNDEGGFNIFLSINVGVGWADDIFYKNDIDVFNDLRYESNELNIKIQSMFSSYPNNTISIVELKQILEIKEKDFTFTYNPKESA